jgi:hypothetical protein
MKKQSDKKEQKFFLNNLRKFSIQVKLIKSLKKISNHIYFLNYHHLIRMISHCFSHQF